MPEETYFEIDEPSDWIIIEGLLTKKKRNNFIEKKNLKINTLILDVDGTLTDGGMYYSPQGEFMKKFNTRDAFGIRLLMNKGIDVIVITSENSKIVEERLKKMKIAEFYLGINDKFSLLEKIKLKKKIEWVTIGYIGDDLNDLKAMKSVGFKACPSDAEKEILEIADFISPKRAGYGAIREIINYLLKVNNFD
jgi:N-acylneuraminate cytidylyltransferase